VQGLVFGEAVREHDSRQGEREDRQHRAQRTITEMAPAHQQAGQQEQVPQWIGGGDQCGGEGLVRPQQCRTEHQGPTACDEGRDDQRSIQGCASA